MGLECLEKNIKKEEIRYDNNGNRNVPKHPRL